MPTDNQRGEKEFRGTYIRDRAIWQRTRTRPRCKGTSPALEIRTRDRRIECNFPLLIYKKLGSPVAGSLNLRFSVSLWGKSSHSRADDWSRKENGLQGTIKALSAVHATPKQALPLQYIYIHQQDFFHFIDFITTFDTKRDVVWFDKI